MNSKKWLFVTIFVAVGFTVGFLLVAQGSALFGILGFIVVLLTVTIPPGYVFNQLWAQALKQVAKEIKEKRNAS